MTMYGEDSSAKKERRCVHVGQQRFDTPITRAYPYGKKKGSEDKNMSEIV
jgi:hypothetical protein